MLLGWQIKKKKFLLCACDHADCSSCIFNPIAGSRERSVEKGSLWVGYRVLRSRLLLNSRDDEHPILMEGIVYVGCG